MLKLPELVEIQWLDSNTGHGWQTDREVSDLEPAWIMSTGYVVFENDAQLQLSGSVADSDGKWSCVTAIPKIVIRTRRTVEPAREFELATEPNAVATYTNGVTPGIGNVLI